MECIGKHYIQNFTVKNSKVFNEDILNKGISIYEVIRIENEIPLFLENHLTRLFHSADISGLAINESYCDFEKLITELIYKNNFHTGNIKLVIHFMSEYPKMENNLLLYFTPHYYPSDNEYRFGVKTGFCKAVRTNPNVKVLNTEARNRANHVIAEKKLFEVLLLDQNGFITEGSRSNVFFIKNDIIITPPESKVLIGVTRTNIVKLCKENNIKIIEDKVHYNDINKMDTTFLTGTSLKVLPVSSIDEIKMNTQNDFLKKIQGLYDSSIEKYIKERLT